MNDNLRAARGILLSAILGILLWLGGGVLLTRCNAANLEIAIGATRYRTAENNLWWQEGYPHDNRLTTISGWIGYSGNITPIFGWRVSAVDLGKISNTAIWTTDDDCNQGIKGPTYAGEGAGHVYGLTIAPTASITRRGWTLQGELGAFAYHGYWSERYNPGDGWESYALNATYHQNRVTGYAGLMLQHSNVFVSVRSYREVSVGALYGKDATQATLGYQWRF